MTILGSIYGNGVRIIRDVMAKHEPLLEQLGWVNRNGLWETTSWEVVHETIRNGKYCPRNHLFFFYKEYVDNNLPNRWTVGLSKILAE